MHPSQENALDQLDEDQLRGQVEVLLLDDEDDDDDEDSLSLHSFPDQLISLPEPEDAEEISATLQPNSDRELAI